MFQVFASGTVRIRQTNKQKGIITACKGFIGTCIKSKKTAYMQYV